MGRLNEEEKRYEVQNLINALAEDANKQIRLLEAISSDYRFYSPKKLNRELIEYADLSEETFLKGKQLTCLIETGEAVSDYDFKNMGTTESFPCSLSFDGSVWEFFLPPTASVKLGVRVRAAGRYIGYLVRNLINNYEEEHGEIAPLSSPVVAFEHGLVRGTPNSRLYDADNRDNKRIVDAMTGTFFEDDNLLTITTMHYGAASDSEYTRVFVMELDVFKDWIGKNSQR